jgi:hypothetical protein
MTTLVPFWDELVLISTKVFFQFLQVRWMATMCFYWLSKFYLAQEVATWKSPCS